MFKKAKTASTPSTIITAQPDLANKIFANLGKLELNDFMEMLSTIIEETSLPKDIFDDIIKTFGESVSKPAPEKIISFLFDVLEGDISHDFDFDTHSYYLIVNSLNNLISKNDETRLIKDITLYVLEDTKPGSEQSDIIRILHSLVTKNLK